MGVATLLFRERIVNFYSKINLKRGAFKHALYNRKTEFISGFS